MNQPFQINLHICASWQQLCCASGGNYFANVCAPLIKRIYKMITPTTTTDCQVTTYIYSVRKTQTMENQNQFTRFSVIYPILFGLYFLSLSLQIFCRKSLQLKELKKWLKILLGHVHGDQVRFHQRCATKLR